MKRRAYNCGAYFAVNAGIAVACINNGASSGDSVIEAIMDVE